MLRLIQNSQWKAFLINRRLNRRAHLYVKESALFRATWEQNPVNPRMQFSNIYWRPCGSISSILFFSSKHLYSNYFFNRRSLEKAFSSETSPQRVENNRCERNKYILSPMVEEEKANIKTSLRVEEIKRQKKERKKYKKNFFSSNFRSAFLERRRNDTRRIILIWKLSRNIF